MKKFHDVKIYAGTEVATTSSRLELGAKIPFLRKIFSEMKFCEGCREPVVIIFPDEDKTTLREAFDQLAHFKSGLSIIQSAYYIALILGSECIIQLILDPEKVNSLLARLRETTRDRSSRRIRSDSQPREVGPSQSQGQGSGECPGMEAVNTGEVSGS